MTERSHHSDRPDQADGAYPSAGQGESAAWSVLATMIGGPLLYGLIGHVVDRAAGVSFGVPVGIVVGFVLSGYIIYLRYGRD